MSQVATNGIDIASPVVRQRLTNYNSRLETARKARGYTQKDLAELTGINTFVLSEYERLLRVPTPEHMDEISAALDQPVGYLFPPVLIEAVRTGITAPRTRYVLHENLLAYSELRALPAPGNMETEIIEIEKRNTISELLGTLTPREQKVMSMYYGFNEEGISYEFAEIGKMLGVTSVRIQQIRNKTLRKLRHPSLSRKLKPFRKIDRL